MKVHDIVIAAVGAVLATLWSVSDRPRSTVLAAEEKPAAIIIDYPQNDSIFPPEITPPTFIWRDSVKDVNRWRIEVHFSDGSSTIHAESSGPPISIGEIDPRCISARNELPKLSPEQAAAHTWIPDSRTWQRIKQHSVTGPAHFTITGFTSEDMRRPVSDGKVDISTSQHHVGAPIFYRDVPLMPSETEKGVIKPLAPTAIPLIQWRLRSIDQPQSRVVLEGMHTCANCHSFSRDGKTLGMDMDGPQNDKGLYAVVSLKPQTEIRSQDMISWNPTGDRQFAFNRVGFMSQVSPDGRYVLTMVTSAERPSENNYYVANFLDYKFLQVFYPTRGVLYWYDRTTGERHPVPGADDPNYVQANGVWSPDGKYIVFIRAKAQDPYPPGRPSATRSNDPNEIQIQYDIYRVPFNDGKGGKAEPIAGASANGMSNSFPKISPDGKWLVFVQAHNGLLMRPDGQLYIVPAEGGIPRKMRANMYPMNSWHSWSPNGRWLVFSSKSRGPFTRMYLTHVDDQGNDSPAIYIDNPTASNRAVNLPEFVDIPPDGLVKINTPAVEMYTQFDHAVELAEKGQEAEAITEWIKLKNDNPDNARIVNNLGVALTRTGKYDEAVPQFEKALELNPQYNLVHVNLGRALMGAGQTDAAVAEYEKAVQLYPDSADLHNSLGSALEQQGRIDDAIAQFKNAIQIDPELADAHNFLGLALLSQGQAGQQAAAQQEFKTAIALKPDFADAENNLGTLYGKQGNDAAAEQMFREAIKNDPAFPRAMVNLAATLASESKFSEADAVVQQALQLDPANKEALQLQAMLKGQGSQ
ncbi:MAG: tetratricopeptide repeat protein [Terracidiphilus sp.]